MLNSKLENALVSTSFLITQTSASQSELVDECLCRGVFNYDDIINRFKFRSYDGNYVSVTDLLASDIRISEAIRREIFDWIPVTDLLACRLIENGAPVLYNFYGRWWGRTTNETTIYQDPIMLKIAAELEEKLKGKANV